MQKMPNKFAALAVVCSILLQPFPALGAGASLDGLMGRLRHLEQALPESQASEFVLRRFPGEKLVPVRILGGVQKPGIYYLPEGTDLLTAISLSAGLEKDSDQNKVVYNRGGGTDKQVLKLGELLENPQKNAPILQPNDLLFVEKTEPAISSNTMLWLTAVSSVIGIAVGAIALSKIK